jgi:cell division transport system ATP-binding protein
MIQFTHAYKTYPGPKHALKDIHLEVDKGEFVFITGPSGAGKTTLFRLLSAFDKPTSGGVNVLGKNIEKISGDEVAYFRRHIGVVYQDFRLLNRLSIFENIALPLHVKNESERLIKDKVHRVLNDVGLFHKKNDYPEQLSGGEQQRVAIARAIIHKPNLLIADEPTGNLDPDLAKEIMRLFESINAQGTTIIIASHDLDTVHKMSKRNVVLNGGQIIKDTKFL